MKDVMEKLTGIFREVFDNPDITITRETTADDIEEWDSMTHMNLILMVELKFEIEFNQREVMAFDDVGDLADAIAKKIA